MAYPGDNRCFPNTLRAVAVSDGAVPPLLDEASRVELSTALSVITEHLSSPDSDDPTFGDPCVYVGLSGLAAFFLKLCALRASQGDDAAAAHALSRAARFSASALRLLSQKGEHRRGAGERVTFLEGAPGVHAVAAAVAAALGDTAAAARHASAVTDTDVSTLLPNPGDCELLYGRCGYIHALLSASAAAGAQPDGNALCRVATEVVTAGAASADAAGPAFASKWGLLFSWHGKAYLGAAHGLAGIVLTLLQAEAALMPQQSSPSPLSPPSSPSLCQRGGGESPPSPLLSRLHCERVRAATMALASSLDADGNLPSSLHHPSDDNGFFSCSATSVPSGDAHSSPSSARSTHPLVHFCHGAPGLLLCLASSARHSGPCGVAQPLLNAAATRAADCVWCRGLLRKGLGLCHGVGGTGYALLAAHRATGDAIHLVRAREVAMWGASQVNSSLATRPDHPASLFEGLAGFGCFVIDVLGGGDEGLFRARMPGAEL